MSTRIARHFGRVALWQGWADRVRAERRWAIGAAMLASYAVGLLIIVPMGPSVWVSVLGWSVTYFFSMVAAWRWSFGIARATTCRADRLQDWLEQLRLALPDKTIIDITAKLTRGRCRRGGDCAAPWIDASLFLPDGGTLAVEVLEGRLCPLLPKSLAPGRTVISLRLLCDSIAENTALQSMLERMGDGVGFVTRTLRSRGPQHLYWRLEQQRDSSSTGIAAWPIVRLIRLCTGVDGGIEPVEVNGSATVVTSRCNRLERAAGTAEFCAPLWSHRERLGPAIDRARTAMQRTVRRPSVTLMTLMSAGIASIGLGGWLVGVIGDLGIVWQPLWLVGVGVLIVDGMLHAWRLMRGYRARLCDGGHAPVGDVWVAGTGIVVRRYDTSAPEVRFDFSQPCQMHVTRAPNGVGDTVDLHLTLQQIKPNGTARMGFTSSVERTPQVLALPCKVETYVVIDSQGLGAIWETVRMVVQAHGQVPPPPPPPSLRENGWI